MALEIRQNLKFSQQLVITPQMQQAIKMLQLSRMELVEMIQEELLENPILEEEIEGESFQEASSSTTEEASFEIPETPPETSPQQQEALSESNGEIKEPNDFNWEDYLNSYNSSERWENTPYSPSDELPSYEATLSSTPGLQEHLLWQLHLTKLSLEDEEVGTMIIGNIDDEGYLSATVEEIASQNSISQEKVEAVLEKIQRFDPPGVGARDLKECLLLQIKGLGADPILLGKIIEEFLPELERKDYNKIAKQTQISIDKIVEIAELIHGLEPKPGRPFSKSSTEYVVPDAYLLKLGETWQITLNEDGLPKLRISSLYQQMMRGESLKDQAKEYVQSKMRSALWFIKSIHQRQRTLYRTIEAILKFQEDFFEKGVDHLKPMILKDVAEEIGMHESTISRVTTRKYLHTSQGIFELKYFFNNGVPSSHGDSVASESIKNKIKQIISREDIKSPYSDQEIVELLKENKIDLARRTVAKYRELLGIASSSKRKRFF